VWGSGDAASHAALSDGVVLTPAGPWTDTVLALLRHLERAGWPGAPRPVGSGRAADGRMALTYVPGESTHPQAWADEVVGRVGELLRGLHDATASFVAPSAAVWQGHWLREIGEQDLVIGHGDPAPWNIVGPGRTPQFLVDWEYAGPVDRLTELAHAARSWWTGCSGTGDSCPPQSSDRRLPPVQPVARRQGELDPGRVAEDAEVIAWRGLGLLEQHLATELDGPRQGGVEILHLDVAQHIAWLEHPAHRLEPTGQVREAAAEMTVAEPGVADLLVGLDRPAEQLPVELPGRGRVVADDVDVSDACGHGART
jgi:hypothetical protein